MHRPVLSSDDVLYRDDHLLVVNKPAGVPVHGSRMLEGRPETLLAMTRELTGRLVHPVHRLDRPASGAILLAIDRTGLAAMSSAFEKREVEKRYLAVARGWTGAAGRVDYALLPPRDERRPGSEPRNASTHYSRLATLELPFAVAPYATARYSLLELNPETGRRHQIRRHMKHISHPLVGDTTYGKGEHNRVFREQFQSARLLLHSRSLAFHHPSGGEWIEVTAPLDPAFDRVARAFGWSAGLKAHS
ncbi:MAG: pseudouridylate synthase [Xanthomonadales bacterium]|nr:pseudouridylate synthase [Gammaproteobacteria bacterium]MBT8057783.1 pseudouridylate synthase [Gammaproteobacteria bacterium]NNJ77792.1 pseudouridylate synthase [Xanthomonadales bacterium]NNL04669.1 pseudouridylate synthase [Xanthomonadales bacterium]